MTDEDKAWFAERFDAVNKRLDSQGSRFDDIASRLSAHDSRFDDIASRFDAVNKRLDDLTRFTLDLRAETSRRFDTLDQRLDFMANALLNIQPLNKAMVELGSLMGQMARSEQHATDRHFALETRVAQLEEKLSKLHPAA